MLFNCTGGYLIMPLWIISYSIASNVFNPVASDVFNSTASYISNPICSDNYSLAASNILDFTLPNNVSDHTVSKASKCYNFCV